MKILYFTTFDLSLAKGPSINEREFVGQLFLHKGIEALAIIPKFTTSLDNLPRRNCRFIKNAWGPSISGIFCSEREIEKAIFTELVEFKPDIVVGRLALLPFGCLRALRYSRIPFAVKSLGSAGFVADGWNVNQTIIRLLRPIIRSVLRRVVRRAQMIDTTTNELRTLLIKKVEASPDSIFVVPNATNTVRFNPCDSSGMRESLGIPKDGVVIGYTGGTPMERGGREVIQVVNRLRSEDIDAYGVVVGGVPSKVLKIAQQYNMTEYIFAPGRVDYATMPNWINVIDVGIALDNSKRSMKIGNSYQKIRQFIACGRFIITQIDRCDPVAECPVVVQLGKKDIDTIYSAARGILELSRVDRKALQIAGRAFAVRNLSLDVAVEKRVSLWEAYI